MEKKNKNEQKNTQSNKKPRFTLGWKLLTIVISLLIIYTGYHVLFGLSESVPTTAAGLVEQNSSVMLEGVIFRNEEPIKTKYQGDMRPYFANGERVSTDSLVAEMYSEFSGEDINGKIEEIKEKIEILERSNVKRITSVVDIEKLKSEIDKLYTSLMLANSNKESYKVKAIQKELTIALNKMRIYRGELKNYNAEIEVLKSELDALYGLFKGEKEYVYAENGGYFYYSCDGYEDALTYEKLSSMTSDSLREILEQTKSNPRINSAYTCKFVYESTWKLVSYCDDATALMLEVGKEYSITLFDIKERELKATLEVMSESQNGSRLLVFSSVDMPEGFDFTRYQSFKLDVSKTEGYRVPKEALQTVVDKESGEEKVGVYILNASVVYFRRVDIIAEGNGYYIVSTLDKSKENYQEYLNINDLIILEPDGMYDGKILTK